MGLIQFDFLFAEQIGETDTTIEYRCTMDQKFSQSSHTFKINKEVFQGVIKAKNDFITYILECMENELIIVPGIKVTKKTRLNEIEFDRLEAIRYIFKAFLKEGKIPKKVGAISPEFEKRLEAIEASMRS